MNLVIGITSQISHFFPEGYLKISSRNIDFSFILSKKWDCIYICFAEQRTFDTKLSEQDFIDVNLIYTSEVIDKLQNCTKKIVIYGTAELWNNYNGPVSINFPINYKYSPYVKSKELLNYMLEEKRTNGEWLNVLIIHPFNFNSMYRKEGFLFHKIYNSLVSGIKTKVGNLDINRDLIHVDYLVKRSISSEMDTIVGSGKLTNIRSFISEIFLSFSKDYKEFIIETDLTLPSPHIKNSFWLDTHDVYNDLLKDTLEEIKNTTIVAKI